MYTSVARLGIDSAARARRKLLASVFRRHAQRLREDADTTAMLEYMLGTGRAE